MDVASGFVEWADSRFFRDDPSVFLSAAVVSHGDLQQVLQQVVSELTKIAPRLPADEDKEVGRSLIERITEELSWILEGAESLAMAWMSSVYGDVFDEEDDDGLLQADVGPFAKAYLRHVVGDTAANNRRAWWKLCTQRGEQATVGVVKLLSGSQRSAISRRAWHLALEDAIRVAVTDLHEFVVKKRFLRVLPQSTGVQKKFAASCRMLRKASATKRSIRAASWTKASRVLHANVMAWMTSEMQNHVTRNKKTASKIALNRKLANILQYSTLMQGNWGGGEVTMQVRHLRDICAAIVGTLRGAPSPKTGAEKKRVVKKKQGGSSSVSRRLKMLDNEVLGKDQVDRWRQFLGDDAIAIGKVVAEIVHPRGGTKPQAAPWWKREYIGVFRKFWPTGENNNDDSLDDAFVNKCLTPLQGLGLAAQVPEDLWRRANELEGVMRAKGDLQKVKPLKTHIGKKWIVNPFGLVLATDA